MNIRKLSKKPKVLQNSNLSNTEPSDENNARKIEDLSWLTFYCENKNTSGEAVECILFGAGDFGATDYQAEEGAVVVACESSHALVRASSINKPFKIKGLRYITSDREQMCFQETPLFVKRSATGRVEIEPFRPLSHMTAYQQQSCQIDATDVSFDADLEFQMMIPVLPGKSVTVILQIDNGLGKSLKTGMTSVNIINEAPTFTNRSSIKKLIDYIFKK